MKTYLDRGGTFTDVVTIHQSGELTFKKVRSNLAVAGTLAKGALTFGTTVATNALLERTQARTLLLVTQGFGDLLCIGDMTRPLLFDVEKDWPKSLDATVLEMDGRLDSTGRELVPLTLPNIDFAAYEAVAIAFLHSPKNPAHELAVAKHIQHIAPNVLVSLGHMQSPGIGYLERIQTTLVDAAITPCLHRALERDQIPQHSLAIRSDGTLCPTETLRAPEAVLSGPAGGVLAVAEIARQAGFANAIGLDMGGTSTDVCRIEHGKALRSEQGLRINGTHIHRSTIEVETIAAGGGSILQNGPFGYQVGPASAGADPGPQCYGNGGPPTLTDAALALGRIDPKQFTPPLDPTCVQLPGSPKAYLDVAHETMAAAIRKIATGKGIDLSNHVLVAYGGAAGQHAAEVAAHVGIGEVLFHPCAAVLSAWGQQLAPREESQTQAIWAPLHACYATLSERLIELEQHLPSWRECEYSIGLRSGHSNHIIRLTVEHDITRNELIKAFQVQYAQQFGFTMPEASIEVVDVRCTKRFETVPKLSTQSYDWGLNGQPIDGPKSLFFSTTAVFIPEGWRAREQDGLLRLTQIKRITGPLMPENVALQRTLWANRFMSIAEQAGELLARTARSVNIRERKDFSCALFDTRGRLIANAPHIPVHLGAMGETVRDLMKHVPNSAFVHGDSWVTNTPFAGGSHLPDLTVITPVVLGAATMFIACRAHHVDVGGMSPGSMPSHSKTLSDEGILFERVRLTKNNTLLPLEPLLRESRMAETVHADLIAQIAANQFARQALHRFENPEEVHHWAQEIQDHASNAIQRIIQRLDEGTATDTLDGLPIAIRVQPHATDGKLDVFLSAPEGPHPGNLNTPPAVIRSAILYGLRVLAQTDIPLNEGIMDTVTLHIPHPSIFSPPKTAAVVGGNVETSQRIVDLFLKATKTMAFSQGTMNNFTVGNSNWAYYETIGGGQGATSNGPGLQGRQCHMTNTRITDVEVLEHRTPLHLERFSLRYGSGGQGHHSGGCGLIRVFRFLADAEASMLAAWRPEGADGLDGGDSGKPGDATLYQNDVAIRWDGTPLQVKKGDRLVIKTPGGGGWGPKI